VGATGSGFAALATVREPADEINLLARCVRDPRKGDVAGRSPNGVPRAGKGLFSLAHLWTGADEAVDLGEGPRSFEPGPRCLPKSTLLRRPAGSSLLAFGSETREDEHSRIVFLVAAASSSRLLTRIELADNVMSALHMPGANAAALVDRGAVERIRVESGYQLLLIRCCMGEAPAQDHGTKDETAKPSHSLPETISEVQLPSSRFHANTNPSGPSQVIELSSPIVSTTASLPSLLVDRTSTPSAKLNRGDRLEEEELVAFTFHRGHLRRLGVLANLERQVKEGEPSCSLGTSSQLPPLSSSRSFKRRFSR
jgi:hypothetical protein